jgi:hypothetical protein
MFIHVSVKEIVPRANPWSVDKEELMSSLKDKAFIAGTVGVDVFV